MTPLTLALTGDVMLGRLVNEALRVHGPAHVWDQDLSSLMRSADRLLVNLECALTTSAERWHDGSYKAFYFRADPALGIEALRLAGVDFASTANNHACDYGTRGLLDTLAALDAAGIAHAGGGRDLDAAHAPAVVDAGGLRVAISAWADYPMHWAATEGDAGINYTEISTAPEDFAPIETALRESRSAGDLVVFCIHWGPNMRERPPALFREFAHAVIEAGADVFWGHSAHIVQGIEVHRGRPILYDTGDFLDDYAVDPVVRNDLSALFLLRIVDGRVSSLELVPTRIGGEQAKLASGDDRDWFVQRFEALCGELGTVVEGYDGRLTVRMVAGKEAQG